MSEIKQRREAFRKFLNGTVASSTANSYMKAMDKTIPEKLKDGFSTVFEIRDIEKLKELKERLHQEKDMKDFNDDTTNKGAPSAVIGNYIKFLISEDTAPEVAEGTVLEKTLTEQLQTLLKANHNLVLTGAPGTGKTYLAKQIAEAMEAETEFVQFHASYDYSDFVEGLRPVISASGQASFALRDGIFKAFCKKAAADLDHKYIFIIDEINRAEPSRVLGELFFAIDPSYRGEAGKVQTQYANLNTELMPGCKKLGEFYVPENVYIIGTMNDIDRSVDSMDFAMRRRFTWREISAEETAEEILAQLPDWEWRLPRWEDGENHVDCLRVSNKDALSGMNEYIDKELSELGAAYHLGAAYFLKAKDYVEMFQKDKEDHELWVAIANALWDNHLKPLLAEYLRGMPDKEAHLEALCKCYWAEGYVPLEQSKKENKDAEG